MHFQVIITKFEPSKHRSVVGKYVQCPAAKMRLHFLVLVTESLNKRSELPNADSKHGEKIS